MLRQAYVSASDHRHVDVKRTVIGSIGGWKLRVIINRNVFRDWSIINIGKNTFMRRKYIRCNLLNNISLLLLMKFTGMA